MPSVPALHSSLRETAQGRARRPRLAGGLWHAANNGMRARMLGSAQAVAGVWCRTSLVGGEGRGRVEGRGGGRAGGGGEEYRMGTHQRSEERRVGKECKA